MKKNIFLEEAKKVHRDKYSYELSDEFKKTDKIKIYCPIHGLFLQTPKNHLKGQGCPTCGKEYAKNLRKNNFESFINKCNKRFGNRYSYPNIKNEYENSHSKITIKCNICGKIFTKIACDHITSKEGGCNCKKNSVDYIRLCYKFKNINIAKFYGYKNILHDSVYIICDIHGAYKTNLKSLYKGKYKCKLCTLTESSKVRKLSSKDFSDRLSEITNNMITILDKYIDTNTKIRFKCNVCGNIFERKPSVFLNTLLSNPCPHCSKLELSKINTKTTEEYINECILLYGKDTYDFSRTKYTSSNKKVTIKCNKCGKYFDIEANSFLQGHGCPYHNCNSSLQEKELNKFINEIGFDTITNNRNILEGKEIDIFIPDKNIGIEFDGLYWHNELNKDKNYHLDKTLKCNDIGVRLIHIFEDEWINKKDIWKSMLKNILSSKQNNVIYARKCEIKEINAKLCDNFLNENHLQGRCNSKYKYGLFYNNELVSVMTFGYTRHFIGSMKHEYELLRFCNKLNTQVVGGASKLLKYFIKLHNPKNIVSYADRRWSNGNLYNKLGFKLYNTSKPNYYYVIGNERKNRFNFRKSILITKYNCPENLSEHEFCKSKKWWRIYDCGCLCYELNLIND